MIILNQLSLRHFPLDNIILLTIQLNCGIEFNCELSDFSGTFAIARPYVKKNQKFFTEASLMSSEVKVTSKPKKSFRN